MRHSYAPAIVVYTDAGGIERQGYVVGNYGPHAVKIQRAGYENVIDVVRADAYRLRY